MDDAIIRLLEVYEPLISAVVGVLTIAAGAWGLIRFGFFGRAAPALEDPSAPAQTLRKKVFDLGLTQHSKLEERVAVRTVNVVLMCLMGLSLPWMLVMLGGAQSAFLSFVNLATFAAALVGFAFQLAGAATAARWLVVVTTSLYWLANIVAVGPEHGVEYFLAGLIALPVLSISRAKPGARAASLVFIIGVFLCGIFFTWEGTGIVDLSPRTLVAGYHANALLLALVTFIAVGYYKSHAANGFLLLHREKSAKDAFIARLVPHDIADQLQREERAEASWHPHSTVLYVTLRGFGSLYSSKPAIDLVAKLDQLYMRFDELIDRHGLEKIKTLGTTYVAISGINSDVARATPVALAALEMRDVVLRFKDEHELPLKFACGIAAGACVSGVIGKSQPRFDVWGEALEAAATLQSQANDGELLVNQKAYDQLTEHCLFSNATSPNAHSLDAVTGV